jgi:hypothetical protein
MSWLDLARDRSTAELAAALGYPVRVHTSGISTTCPACHAERRHTKSGDRRGAVGMRKASPAGWQCFQCGEAGDAVDFAAWHVGGRRFRDLPSDHYDRVRELFGIADDWQPRAVPIARPERHLEAAENAETDYPPVSDVERLWEASRAVSSDRGAVAYLAHRGIPLAGLDHHDCVRALPEGADVPAWATWQGRPWSRTGYRLLVPLYDWRGELRSVLARSVELHPAGPKSVGAVGHGRRGLVMAATHGRQLMESGPHLWWHRTVNLRVAVYEGEVSWMRSVGAGWECELEADYELAGWRMSLGIVSGSFTRDVASRIPDATTVHLRTDDDDAGKKYAADIQAALGERVSYEMELEADDAIR